MAVSNKITTYQIQGFREEISKAKQYGEKAFYTWFNESKDKDATFVRGEWDFSFHIADPLAGYIKNPEAKTVLEIGYGGGRLLAAASRYFKKAIGVDIHNESLIVRKDLRKRGIRNVRLIYGNGKKIPLPDSSVDVVYSFIVLQHVQKIDIFRNYFKETYRILRPGGMAILYYGRYCRFSRGKSSRWLYLLDYLLEIMLMPKGYKEIASKINDVNLIVSQRYARKLSTKVGFEVNNSIVSRKNVPDDINLYGGQHGILLCKPL